MRKMRLLMTAIAMTIALTVTAQTEAYRCTYEMTMDISSQLSSIEDASLRNAIVEQLDMAKMHFVLLYADGKSLFAVDEKATANPFAGQTGHTIYIDYGTKQQVCQEVFFGRTFLIEEPLETTNWAIGTEQREIAGRTCIKATTTIEGQTATAWFSPETPIPAGPMGEWGLPGLIVRLETPSAIYTLTKIEATTDGKALRRPTKGKKMSRKEYEETMQQRLQQMGLNMGGGGVQIIQMN